MAKISIELGRLLCKEFRNFVNGMIAEGYDLKLWEGEGFLIRPFVVSGSDKDVGIVYRSLQQWERKINAAR